MTTSPKANVYRTKLAATSSGTSSGMKLSRGGTSSRTVLPALRRAASDSVMVAPMMRDRDGRGGEDVEDLGLADEDIGGRIGFVDA